MNFTIICIFSLPLVRYECDVLSGSWLSWEFIELVLFGILRLIKLSMRDLSVEVDLGKSEVPRTVSDFFSLSCWLRCCSVVVGLAVGVAVWPRW